jgi:lysophospholipase L1-like esterase
MPRRLSTFLAHVLFVATALGLGSLACEPAGRTAGELSTVDAGKVGDDGTGVSPTSAGGASGDSSTCAAGGSPMDSTPTIYVIGDSTASVYASSQAPRMGWAQTLDAYFAPACAIVSDRALSGRSSKSFFDEGAWTPIVDALRPGDFVLIQFGHNDEKVDDPTRGTDPFTTYTQYLSRYVDDTLGKQATPILLTSICRNSWEGDQLSDTHGDYPVAVRKLAEERAVALVDATLLTETYFESIGPDATTRLFMNLAPGESPNYPEGNVDNTHLRDTGAHVVAELILADLFKQNLAPGTLVREVPSVN